MNSADDSIARKPRRTPDAAVAPSKRHLAGMHLARIHGIDVNVDWSVLVIFFLISFSLSWLTLQPSAA